jgi:ferritin
MNTPLDTVLFNGKTSSDVFKEIYDNSKKKDKQINSLIAELKPLIQNIGDAPVVVPLIKEYLEVSVKNDEHLIKMMAVIQRMGNNNGSNGSDSLLTDEELKQLQQIAEEVAQDADKSTKNTKGSKE